MNRKSFNSGWIANPLDRYMLFMNPESAQDEVAVTLPYDVMLHKERKADTYLGRNTGFYPSAVCTLAKRFDVPADWRDKSVTFEFEGVYSNSMIYINGDYAGGCPHGYTCFTVPADAFLKYGEQNEIKVMAKTHQDSRWYTGVGIYRNVNILVGGLCHITPYGQRIRTPEVDHDGAVAEVETTLINKGHETSSSRVETILLDAGGNTVAKQSSPLAVFAGETAKITQRMYISGAKRWDIDTPYLYTAVTRVSEGNTLLDESQSTFGIRTLSLDVKHGLRLNGKTLRLRGACVHHDNGILGAADIPRAEERRVQLLKAAGFNAVRSAHNPISRAFLEACDRNGLVVMDELTDVWTRRKNEFDYSTAFPSHWPQLVEAMVDKDYNHPSVVMYSIGNEIMENGTAHGAKIGRMLAQRLKELDPTRYTINSANLLMAAMDQIPKPENVDVNTTDINAIMNDLGSLMDHFTASEAVAAITEEAFASVDIAGYNYATIRYEIDKKRFPDRVLCGSETAPKKIAENWALIQSNPQIIGDFTWTGWDYLGEAGIGAMKYKEDDRSGNAAYPWYIAWCGDMDITGHRRPVSYYREIVFGLRKQPYMAVRYPHTFGKTLIPETWDFVDGIASWTWTGSEGKPVEVEVYAPGERVELLLNGSKVGEVKLEAYKAVIETVYQPGELVAVSYTDGRESGRFALNTAGSTVRLNAAPDRSDIRADDTDLCYIDITLTDEKGIVNTMADRSVSATVSGNGVLAGLGSANPQSEESFLAGRFSSFEGRLLAIVRPTGKGEIKVEITAEGCEPVTVIIQAD